MTSAPDAVGAGEAGVERVVRERTAELSDLASYLHRLHEEEKRALARELHDELGSLLTAAKLDITYIKSKCAKAAPELVAKCERIASMIDQSTALKRRVIDQLRPSTLDLLGLGPAVRELVDNFTTGNATSAEVEFDNAVAVHGEPALALYRIIEEALANVREHAQASKVQVTIERTDASLRVCVRDDGRGFDPGSVRGAAGNGLASIRQRIAAMGGRMSIDTAPGRGTSIAAEFPPAMGTAST